MCSLDLACFLGGVDTLFDRPNPKDEGYPLLVLGVKPLLHQERVASAFFYAFISLWLLEGPARLISTFFFSSCASFFLFFLFLRFHFILHSHHQGGDCVLSFLAHFFFSLSTLLV